MQDADFGEDEDGWSTEGEGDEHEDELEETKEALAGDQRVSLAKVAQDVKSKAESSQRESARTRVLTVAELEDLFESSAPPLSGSCL